MTRSRFLSALLFLLCVAPAGVYAGSEQIIFSNTDNPNPAPNQTGVFTYAGTQPEDPFFGFWIWCEDPEADNPYAGNCHGAMYFYGIGLTKGVSGEVTEDPNGVYHMDVKSRDGKVDCTLWNVSPILTPGLSNLVNVICTKPAGTGTSPNTLVNVTG
jgi:hypothetical protein